MGDNGALKRLSDYIAEETNKYESSLQTWWKESKYYKPATLRDVFGEAICNDISRFKESLERGNDISLFARYFEEESKQLAKSWYDEDLQCMRPGYEDESNVYAKLYEIAAEATKVR